MRLFYLLLGVLAFPVGAARITVGPNVHVSHDRAKIPHREVVIAADPNHLGRLIACSMFSGPEEATNSAAYISFDNGKTWTAPVVGPEKFSDDPTCKYGPDGTVYYIAKTETVYPRHSSSDSDILMIRRSRDGGKTWDPPIHGILANDRPFMAIDNTAGPNRGHIYAAFNEHVHGEDSAQRPGDSSHPHTVDDFRNTFRLVTYTNHGDCMLYVYDRVLMDQGAGKTASPGVGATVVLSDGSVAFLGSHNQAGPDRQPTGKLIYKNTWLSLFLSTDGGETIEPARKVADVQSTYNLPTSRGVTGDMATATGGKFKDRLYVVWADTASGRARILFTYSSDRGLNWSAPKPIDDNESRSSGGPDDFMPQVAVNKDGVVGVQWYDRRDNPDNQGYYVRFTASLDGGDTWLPSVRVSEAPNFPPNPRPSGGAFTITGGDTAGVAVDANGVFHSLWIDNRTGVQQVWTAPITVK